MLCKLAFKNLKKSFKDYAIYFLTLVFGISVFYMFNSIDSQTAMLSVSSSKSDMIKTLVGLISGVSVFISVVLAFLVIYANNFLIKRRKKEFGIYMQLGMGKRQISRVLLIETIVVGIVSLITGLLVGIIGSQFLSIATASLLESNLDKLAFVFSKAACLKTMLYFAIIYAIVIIFNVFSITKYKLIDLLTADKKNEKSIVKKTWLSFIIFIVSITFIGIAYYMLNHGALMFFDHKMLTMLALGGIGTLLLFVSLSGFLVKMIEMNKKLYYKNLNIFVFKQLNSNIKSAVASITIISLMLLLTIGTMASAFSMVAIFNKDFKKNCRVDYSFMNVVQIGEMPKEQLERYKIDKDSKTFGEILKQFNIDKDKYVSDYLAVKTYKFKDQARFLDFLLDESEAELNERGANLEDVDSFEFMKESDYNKLVTLYGENKEKLNLKDNQCAVMADAEIVSKHFKRSIDKDVKIKLFENELSPIDELKSLPIMNYPMSANTGIIIVKDKYIKDDSKNTVSEVVNLNYRGRTNEEKEHFENKFIAELKRSKEENSGKDIFLNGVSKTEIREQNAGIKAIAIYISAYIGIILSITSAAILALQQLSQSQDNKKRFDSIRKIGATEKEINKALFLQIAMYFFIPLVVAIVHSIVGLEEVLGIISMFGGINIVGNISIVSAFILLVYGTYFVITYKASKKIIKEADKTE